MLLLSSFSFSFTMNVSSKNISSKQHEHVSVIGIDITKFRSLFQVPLDHFQAPGSRSITVPGVASSIAF